MSYLRIWTSILYQRTRENQWVVHSGLIFLIILGFVQAGLGKRTAALETLSQVHRTARMQWMKELVEKYIIANYKSMRDMPRPKASQDITSFFGNRLLVLKAPVTGKEKGVLFVMFSDMFQLLYSCMDLQKLLEDYTLVFEPSWSGYCHSGLLQYVGLEHDVFVLSAQEDDFAFLKRLGSNLIPLDFGPCDWVDPRVAEPFLGNPKEFDIVLNSNWADWKRHYVLFQMLAKAKQKFKVVLIGLNWGGRTRADIERLADFYGVTDQLTILERLPYEKVMDVTSRSRVSILLSLKEGSNRAIAEGILCNLPAVVLSNHIGGIKKNVVPQTGLLAEERDLEVVISKLLTSKIQPREWALEHISCFKSSEKLNAALRTHSKLKGWNWTQDVAGRSNSPESTYIDPADAARLRPFNEGLIRYIKAT